MCHGCFLTSGSIICNWGGGRFVIGRLRRWKGTYFPLSLHQPLNHVWVFLVLSQLYKLVHWGVKEGVLGGSRGDSILVHIACTSLYSSCLQQTNQPPTPALRTPPYQYTGTSRAFPNRCCMEGFAYCGGWKACWIHTHTPQIPCNLLLMQTAFGAAWIGQHWLRVCGWYTLVSHGQLESADTPPPSLASVCVLPYN